MTRTFPATVTRVVDADTIDCTVDLGFHVGIKERFRLFGVNAPESRTRDKAEKARGLAATAFVRDLIRQNDNAVTLDVSKGTGKFGRWLAIVELSEGRTLNDALLAAGHAVRADY